jgi:hypothetical protein
VKRLWCALVAASASVAGCIDFSTSPDEISAIVFEDLPWPSIVAGDSLRDASGAVAQLGALLFDGSGDVVAGPLEFLSQKPSVRIVDGVLVVADDTATGTATLLASTTGLQSITRTLDVVPAPDSIAADGAIVPLEWVVPDDPLENVSGAIGARVFSRAGEEPADVRSWVVSFKLEASDREILPGDTTQLFLVGENGRPSSIDTTDTQGRASRRLRLRIAPGLVPPDSAIITISASYKGTPLADSPVILVLPIRSR